MPCVFLAIGLVSLWTPVVCRPELAYWVTAVIGTLCFVGISMLPDPMRGYPHSPVVKLRCSINTVKAQTRAPQSVQSPV